MNFDKNYKKYPSPTQHLDRESDPNFSISLNKFPLSRELQDRLFFKLLLFFLSTTIYVLHQALAKLHHTQIDDNH